MNLHRAVSNVKLKKEKQWLYLKKWGGARGEGRESNPKGLHYVSVLKERREGEREKNQGKKGL